MKRQYYRFLTLFLSVLIILSANVTVFAAEPRATDYIASQSSGLSRTTGNEFDVFFSVVAGRTVDQIGVYYIQIQRSTDQQSWTTERTLHYTSYSDWVIDNAFANAGIISYTGTSGYYYRARVGFLAKLDGDSEYTYMYSNVIYIP